MVDSWIEAVADRWIEAVADRWIEVRTDSWIEVTQLFRVIMDSADGYMNNSFKVIRAALEDGFRPDIISTDLTVYKAFSEQVYGLPMVMSKYLALGIPLLEVIRDVTKNPAAAMDLGMYGRLLRGCPANFCIFSLEDASYDIRDHDGETIHAQKILVPQAVIAGGNFRYSTPGFWAT